MQCRRCGATIHDGLPVCPHCGERQARQRAYISCTHCRYRAPAASSICPRCGQVLRAQRMPAGVLSMVGLILVAGLALSAGVASYNWTNVQSTAKQHLAAIEMQINEMGGKVLDTASSLAEDDLELATATPTQVIVMILPDEGNPAALAAQMDVVVAPTTVGGAVGGASAPAAAVAIAAATVDVASAASPTAAATAAPATPTATPVPPTATPVPPTATHEPPIATPTPTQLPPTPTPQAAAASAAATGGGGLTYAVQPGDNWYSIARRFGTTQDVLAAYNSRTPSDILQVDEVLRIPSAGTTVSVPTATPLKPTPTTAAPSPTTPPTPTPVIPTVAHLTAPGLLSPMTGDGFTAGTQPVLTWRPAIGMSPDDYYFVRVEFTMRDGLPGYVEERVTTPSFTVPIWVYDMANPPDRLGTWWVQVRRAGPGSQEIEISPPSERRTYYWR